MCRIAASESCVDAPSVIDRGFWSLTFLAQANEAYLSGDAARAFAPLERALDLRKADPEALALLDKVKKRQALDALLEKARSEAKESRLDDAARHFEAALEQLTGDERRAVDDVQKLTDQQIGLVDDIQKKKDHELLGHR